MEKEALSSLSRWVRKWILASTTEAGSGHATSSLSAVEMTVSLLFGGFFKYRVDEPFYHNNDRLIFSKGHAAPLLYALWAAAGAMEPLELLTLRQFGSRLEGHPTRAFPFSEVPTGSLGQGLAVGVGMALAGKLDQLPFRTYVLLGDSEMSEGANWEAMALAAKYELNTLVGMIDVNGLGQTGPTMDGHDLRVYARKAEAFGWNAIMVDDGHDADLLHKAYAIAQTAKKKPTMLICQTIKGKGVHFLEGQEGWHGKALNQTELEQALEGLGEVDEDTRGTITQPAAVRRERRQKAEPIERDADYRQPITTRKAFGHALMELHPAFPELVVLDVELGNSTFVEEYGLRHKDTFFQLYLTEQAGVGVAEGLAIRGKKPVLVTYGAFLTRAFDQIRMMAYARAPVVLVGSHGGVSTGQDGGSQMGLEDIAMMRTVQESAVVYPADHVAAEKLTGLLLDYKGIGFLRLTRMDTGPLYDPSETFWLGGSKTVKQSNQDLVTVVGAGVTLFEALKAYEELARQGIAIRVIDLYSVKPVDGETLVKACKETRAIIVVEDHYPEGGMAEAVRSALVYETTPVHSLAVRKLIKSGKPEELLAYEDIDAKAIERTVHEVLA